MGEAGHSAPIRQGLELPVTFKSGIAIKEPDVVPLPADSMPINSEQLQRIIVRQIDSSAQVHAPTEHVMTFPRTVLRPNVPEQSTELQMTQTCLFITCVKSKIWHWVQCVAAGIGPGVHVHKDVRFLHPKRRIPVLVPAN